MIGLALLMAACAGPTPTAEATEPPSPAAETVEFGGETFTKYPGTKVTIFGVAADEQARLFQSEFDEFSQATDVTVEYEGNKDFETLILVRVEGNNAPDLATRLGIAQARIAAMLLLTLRGTPTLYYGDEIGMTDGLIPAEVEQDLWGKRLPGLGRDPCRTPMQWDASQNAGFSPPRKRLHYGCRWPRISGK